MSVRLPRLPESGGRGQAHDVAHVAGSGVEATRHKEVMDGLPRGRHLVPRHAEMLGGADLLGGFDHWFAPFKNVRLMRLMPLVACN